MTSTGEMIAWFLDNNDLTINQLAEASGVTPKTVYRVINEGAKLSNKIALGLHNLLPGIKIEDIVAYDAKFQFEKQQYEQTSTNSLSTNELIKKFHLKKLYPELKNKPIELIKKAGECLGNTINNNAPDLDGLRYAFSKANNSDNTSSEIWLCAAYHECLALLHNQPLEFKQPIFDSLFYEIKQFSDTDDINSTLYNMKKICKKIGINFYFRSSITNSRIKAVSVSDKDGNVFLFVSDLFKSIEILWLAFVHEMIHIKNGDVFKPGIGETCSKEEEKEINLDSEKYYIEKDVDWSTINTQESIASLAKETNAPAGIIAELSRYHNQCYTNYAVNNFIHYYSSGN